MQINTSINITFTQEDIEKLLHAEVIKHYPQIDVRGVKFNVRRNPQTIDAEIDAQLVGFDTITPVETTHNTEDTSVETAEHIPEIPVEDSEEDVVMPTETIAFDAEDPIEEAVIESKPVMTVADIFNQGM